MSNEDRLEGIEKLLDRYNREIYGQEGGNGSGLKAQMFDMQHTIKDLVAWQKSEKETRRWMIRTFLAVLIIGFATSCYGIFKLGMIHTLQQQQLYTPAPKAPFSAPARPAN